MRSRLAALLSLGVVLAGCSTAPKPPPEPDMSRMVPVNKTCPDELSKSCPPPVEGTNGGQ